MKALPLFIAVLLFLLSDIYAQSWQFYFDNADSLAKNQKHKEAVLFAAKASEIAEKDFGTKSDKFLKSRNLYGKSALFALSKDSAELILTQNMDLCKQTEFLPEAIRNAALFYMTGNKGNDFEKCELLYKSAVDLTLQKNGNKSHQYRTSLAALSDAYVNTGRYTKAVPLRKELLTLDKELFGEKTKEFATSINSAGILYYYLGNYALADSFWTIAAELRKELYGEKHLVYIGTLNNKARALTDMKQLAQALKILEFTANFRKEVLGEMHPDYATSLVDIANVHMYNGKYAEAVELQRKALAIRKEKLGVNHINYTFSLDNLSSVLMHMGNLSEAEDLLKESMEIRKRNLGEKNIEYARSMTSLGRLYKTMGDFDKSELYYFKALELKKEISGESSSDYVSALGDLGGLYEAQGKYVEAEKCYRDVFELKKGSKNEMLPYNLGYGNLQFMMGNYDAALYYFEQAASYYNENSDKKNPNLIGTKNNIARVLTEAGRYAEAEKIYLECAEDRAEVLGKNHPDYATTLSDIANLYRRLGKFDLAFDYQEKALRIREEALGSDNFMISYSLENMGALRESQGLLDSALLHYDKALELRKQTIGQKNVYYNQSLFKKANIFFRKNDFDSALPLFRQVINYHIEEIMAFLPVLSDDERLSMLEKKQPVFSRFRDFCIAYANRQPELISDMFNLNMLTKNVVFSSSQKVKSNIQLSNDSSLIADYELWKMQKRTYAQLLQKSPQENEKSSVDLNEMLIRINELETSISRRSNIFSKSKATKVHSWEEVRNQLKKNEILVEVVRTARVTGYDSIGQETFKTVYALMFVTAETKNSPVLTVIENGNELESKFLNFYKNAVAYKADDNVSYAQFWKPVADVLQKMSRKPFSKVYFSPDGCYHQISLNTLKNPVTGKYLLEESNIFLIGSSRDLLVLQKSELSQNYKNCKAFIFGYPIYDLDEQSGTSKKGERSFSALQLITGQKSVVALLPGTKIEADNVEIVLRQKGVTVKNYKEREANEENFKKLVSPTFLHVATHGYFVPNKQKPNPKTSAEAVENLLMKNPFLRAGLLLSGCQNEQINDNDGILTAAEAMNLSLDDTEIVVLSACETGLGDIRNGEGVFGLQRAFRQAGAKSVVMSLWKVSDEATQLLMTDFYKNLFNGFDKESALKQAQLNLKKHFPEPYYWGAFVLTGE